MIKLKGVPIKFRGKDSITGEYVFGRSIIPYENGILLGNHTKDLFTEVDFNSVAQLVGYDKYGNEVYEGDVVDAFFDGKPDPVFNFQALLLNNFGLPEPMKNLKYIVRRNAE